MISNGAGRSTVTQAPLTRLNVSGGAVKAAAGQITMMTAGRPQAYARCEGVLEAMATIRKKTVAAGLIAGSHTDGPKTAAKRFAEGFQLCTLLNDARILMAGATAFVREAKGQEQQAASKTY